jgi:hypothetical protein
MGRIVRADFHPCPFCRNSVAAEIQDPLLGSFMEPFTRTFTPPLKSSMSLD